MLGKDAQLFGVCKHFEEGEPLPGKLAANDNEAWLLADRLRNPASAVL